MNMATDYRDTVGRARQCHRVFAWGANSYGQLANGNTEDQSVPREITGNDIGIKSISGGGGHTLVITESGQLWVCGSNSKGQLGLGTTVDVNTIKHVIALKDKIIVKAEGGWDFTVIITSNGELYVTGSNIFGQLGLQDQQKIVSLPTVVELPEKTKIVDVAAGLRHVALVTDTGMVYCFGSGKKGQLGLTVDGNKPLSKLSTPGHVPLPEKIIQVVTGSHHTAALSENGTIYLWGCNKFGQMSEDTSAIQQHNTYKTVSFDFDSKVCQLYSGWTHLLALTESGNVYSWGRNDYGQLGRSCDRSYDYIPGLVTGLKKVISLSCGSEHNLAVTVDGTLFSWGWNEHGICGTGDEINVKLPQQVAALKDYQFYHAGCGAGHSFAIGNDVT